MPAMPEDQQRTAGNRRNQPKGAAAPQPPRKDQALVDYPRAEDRMPDGLIFGIFDIAELVGVRRNTATRWVDKLLLPAADGPSVDGRPTWQRPTVLLWCMARGILPADYSAEYEELMRDPKWSVQMERFAREYA